MKTIAAIIAVGTIGFILGRLSRKPQPLASEEQVKWLESQYEDMYECLRDVQAKRIKIVPSDN